MNTESLSRELGTISQSLKSIYRRLEKIEKNTENLVVNSTLSCTRITNIENVCHGRMRAIKWSAVFLLSMIGTAVTCYKTIGG